MRSRGQLEITTLGNSSWMPYAPQGVKGTDDDDDDDDEILKDHVIFRKHTKSHSLQEIKKKTIFWHNS